jgi:hypothetical protein
LKQEEDNVSSEDEFVPADKRNLNHLCKNSNNKEALFRL